MPADVRPRFANIIRATARMMLVVPLAYGTAAVAADAPPGASSCSGCHATSAAVATPVPRLIGRPAADIASAMQQFRSGQRPATVMDRIAKGFSDGESAAIAAWYSNRSE